MTAIRTVVRSDLNAAELSAISRDSLDRALSHPAELLVAVPTSDAIVLGAFQRRSELLGHLDATMHCDKRGTGGAEARIGTGTVWIQLALAEPSVLTPCPPPRLINRYVRPLLRALTKLGVLAHYFDRDWISGSKRPVAAVSFSHDTSTRRATFEALIAVTTPFAIRERSSMMGKTPATLAELNLGASSEEVARAICSAYEDAYGKAQGELSILVPPPDSREDLPLDLPWTSTLAAPIGAIGVGRDRDGIFRMGGELMVSRDALSKLESTLSKLPQDASADTLGACIDAALADPRVALFGVRDLRLIRDAISEARAREAIQP